MLFDTQINFFKMFLHKHNQSVKQFESRSGPTFCQVDLGLNCLQMLSADNKVAAGKEKVKRWSSIDLTRKLIVTKIK